MSQNKVKKGPLPKPPPSVTPEESLNTEQIELEICWCIRELESKLSEGKLTPKQTQEIVKAINILGNATAPLVKKRQTMRSFFKDYKKMMLEQEKKRANPIVKIRPMESNLKSSFIKKGMGHDKPIEGNGGVQKLQNDFLFNFDITE